MKIKLFILSLFIFPMLLKAEVMENDTLIKEFRQNVVVTSTRIGIPIKANPTASSIVTEDEFKTAQRGLSVDEYLRFVPGVRIDNQANGERVHLSIRGQGILTERGIRGTRVIVDGIPLNDPTGFVPDLFNIDFENVDRIEVMRGPSAALYGSGSNAGVINIETPSGSDRNPGINFFTSAGSNNFWKVNAQALGGSSNLNYFTAFSRAMGDGYRQHSKFNTTNFYSKLNFNPSSKLSLTQIFSWADYFNENPEGLNLEQMARNPKLPNDDAIPLNEYQVTRRLIGGLTANYAFNEYNSLTLTGFIKTTTYKEPGSKLIWHRSYLSPGATVQFNTNFDIGSMKNHISLGSDLMFQTLNEYTVRNLKNAAEDSILQSNEQIEQQGIGAFFIDRLEVSDKFSIMAAIRFDDVTNKLIDNKIDSIDLSDSKNFSQPTVKLGAAYILLPELSLFADWGEGFMPPATEEIASNPVNPGGFNKNLTYASSSGPEIGVRGALSNIYYDFAVFYLHTNNDYDRFRIADRPLETFYKNIGNSDRYGIETFVFWKPFEPLTIQAAYTYSHFKYSTNDSINGNWLPNSPEHQLSFDIEYRAIPELAIGFGGDIQSRWTIYSFIKDVYQEGFSLFNARIVYDFKAFGVNSEIGVYGRNLLDRKWVAFTEPDFPDGNSYQPGPGREFFGQLRIKF